MDEYIVERVDDAIILAGGMGTRMLPASLFMPKETLPLVDIPIINHLIWEAARAGVSKIHLVLSSRKKDLLADFLDYGSIHGNTVRPDLSRDSLSLGIDGLEVIPYIQQSALGVADAISVVLEEISGPFLVLLGDNVLLSEHVSPDQSVIDHASDCSQRLVSSYEKTGLPCVGIYEVGSDEIGNYGVVELTEKMVVGIVEKPEKDEAPSNFVLCGRYLLPHNTLAILEEFPVSEFGEMQSIFLLERLMYEGGLVSVKMDYAEMYDSGNPLSWLKSQIDHGLRRRDMRADLEKWIRKRLGN